MKDCLGSVHTLCWYLKGLYRVKLGSPFVYSLGDALWSCLLSLLFVTVWFELLLISSWSRFDDYDCSLSTSD